MKKFLEIFIALLLLLLLADICLAVSLNQKQEALAAFSDDIPPHRVTVAVIDTGISPRRLDTEKILPGQSYVSADPLNTVDLVGHGTRIASLLLGADDGANSITALAPNAVLVPLMYYTKYPSGVAKNGGVEAICQGILDAVDVFSAQIILISSGIDEEHEGLAKAVAYAEEQGVIVLCAAGNDGTDAPMYPAAYDTVVSVGSMDETGRISSFSQRSDNVDLLAPGENLWAVSLRNGDFFEQCSGTSYACAYGASLAARLLGFYPRMTPVQFREVLRELPMGSDGYRLLQVNRALAEYRKRHIKQPPTGSLPLSAEQLLNEAWQYTSVTEEFSRKA